MRDEGVSGGGEVNPWILGDYGVLTQTGSVALRASQPC